MAFRRCPGCGYDKALADGEAVCPPCQHRGYAPAEPASPAGGAGRRGMDGAAALLAAAYMDSDEMRSLARERQRRRYAAADGVAGENEYVMWRAARLRAEA